MNNQDILVSHMTLLVETLECYCHTSDGSRFFALGTFAPPYFGTVAPPYFETSATPHFETVAPPYFGTFALHS